MSMLGQRCPSASPTLLTEEERPRPYTLVPSQLPEDRRLGQAEGRTQELQSGLPEGWHAHSACRLCSGSSEIKQLGLKEHSNMRCCCHRVQFNMLHHNAVSLKIQEFSGNEMGIFFFLEFIFKNPLSVLLRKWGIIFVCKSCVWGECYLGD